MIKGVTHAHLVPIWYLSEPSDIPHSPNQFLGWDFFCHFLQQTGSKKDFKTGGRKKCLILTNLHVEIVHIYINFTVIPCSIVRNKYIPIFSVKQLIDG